MSSKSPQQQLRVIDGQYEPGRIYALNHNYHEIGRLPRDYEPQDHEVLFREPTLSRVHATLTWKARKWAYELVHQSDINVTLVNGKPVKKLLLAPGDRIQLGLLILELEEATEGRGGRSHRLERAENLEKLGAIIAWAEAKYAHVSVDDACSVEGMTKLTKGEGCL